jgi:hypothetical protein
MVMLHELSNFPDPLNHIQLPPKVCCWREATLQSPLVQQRRKRLQKPQQGENGEE